MSPVDHDECATGHDNCDQNCHNSHGSFSCSCNSTWRLDANGYTCNGNILTMLAS